MLEENDFTSIKLFGLNNKMQVIENRQIRPITEVFSPRNAEEIAASEQFKDYVENLESMGLPIPFLKLVSTGTVVNEIRQKVVHSSTKSRQRKAAKIKNVLTADEMASEAEDERKFSASTRANADIASQISDQEEERKFSIKEDQAHEWVRRSSRKRQPVKRYVDEILSGNQELTRNQMKQIKQEIVGEAECGRRWRAN